MRAPGAGAAGWAAGFAGSKAKITRAFSATGPSSVPTRPLITNTAFIRGESGEAARTSDSSAWTSYPSSSGMSPRRYASEARGTGQVSPTRRGVVGISVASCGRNGFLMIRSNSIWRKTRPSVRL